MQNVSPQRQPPMSFRKSISQCLREYASFSGRATRREFWWWLLAVSIGYLVVLIVANLIGFSLLVSIFQLAVVLPTLAVTSRRLHDINKSGWWQLAWLGLAVVALLPSATGFMVGFLRAAQEYKGRWGFEYEDAFSTPEFLIPLILGIVISIVLCAPLAILGIVFMAREGQSGPNDFGFDPRAASGP